MNRAPQMGEERECVGRWVYRNGKRPFAKDDGRHVCRLLPFGITNRQRQRQLG